MADCTRAATQLQVTDGFNLADGYPDPSPADYNDLTINPPGNWGYIGARTPRRYGVGKLGWWPVENGGLHMMEATSDDRSQADPLMDKQDYHELNASYKGGIPVSNTDPDYYSLGSTPPNLTDPFIRVQVDMLAAQAPYYGGPGVYFYKKRGGTYGKYDSFEVRHYNTASNNFKLYQNGIVLATATVDYADRGVIRLDVFHTHNPGAGHDPIDGDWSFRVYQEATGMETPVLTYDDFHDASWTSQDHAYAYGMLVGRGITYFDDFLVQYPGGVVGLTDGWDDPTTVTPLSLPSPEPSIFLFHREQNIQLDTIFMTDVARARTVDEDRRLLASRPNRSLFLNHRALHREEAWPLYMNLMRHGTSRVPVPLFCDHSRVTGAASGTNIPCDTRYRRFFVGQRILIHDWSLQNGASLPNNFEYDTILSFTDSAITTVTGLSGTFAEGDRVYPCIDAEILLGGEMDQHTDDIMDLRLDVEEVYGKSALPPIESGTPTGFVKHDGYPVLSIAPSWVDMEPGMRVEGHKRGLGRGRLLETYGSRPRFWMRIAYDKFSREDIWPLIEFFESRRGRYRAFIFVQHFNPFNIEETNVDYFDVYPTGNFDDFEDILTYVAVLEKDGTLQLATVDYVVDNGATWRIAFVDSLSSAPAIADIRRFAPAHLVRMNSDRLSEVWTTDERCSLVFEVIELLLEQDVTVSCQF